MKKVYDSTFGNLDPVWGVLGGIVYIIVVGYFFLGPLIRMVDDVRLHFTGTVAKQSDCSVSSYQGTRTSSWHVSVSYVAQDGVQYHPEVDTFLWWRRPDNSKPCVVRYAPASPDHISTDWGLSRLFGRVLTYLVIAPIPLLSALVALVTLVKYPFSPKLALVSGSTAPPWHGYVGGLIRQRNRRLFITSLILLLLGSPPFWGHQYGIGYLRAYFCGPRTLQNHDLVPGVFSPRTAGWIQVHATASVDTGVVHTFTFRNGHTFDDGHYLLASVAGQPLLILAKTGATTTPFQGTLEHVDDALRAKLSRQGYQLGTEESAAYYLDALSQTFDSYRRDGIRVLIAFSPFLLVGIPGLWLSLRRSITMARHPFARALAKRGPLDASVQQIDLEMATASQVFSKLRITSHWLILENYWTPIPMRGSDVVWVYHKIVTRAPHCFVFDRLGETLEAEVPKKLGERVQALIAAMAPHPIEGYDASIKKVWNSDIDGAKFTASVRG